VSLQAFRAQPNSAIAFNGVYLLPSTIEDSQCLVLAMIYRCVLYTHQEHGTRRIRHVLALRHLDINKTSDLDYPFKGLT
jgi:hypothetical protein